MGPPLTHISRSSAALIGEMEMTNAVEQVAKALAPVVRDSLPRWHMYPQQTTVDVMDGANKLIVTLWCQDASQAARLAEMMRAPPARGVFAAMGIDPVDPLERFPSIRGKA